MIRDGDDRRSGSGARERVERAVSQIVTLSRSEEACHLLGVDGILVDQVDISVLEDPLDYVAYDLAAAVRDAEEDVAPVLTLMLSRLVAEVRLCGLLAGQIDQYDLVERVIRHLRELEE